MKRALVVQHVRHEGPAGFAAPLAAAGYAIACVHAGDGALGAIDWLAPDLVVSLGGPMGVPDRAAYPWMADEIDGLRTRIAAAGPTLGICLGAQLIAAALGAEVRPGPEREIGFMAVELTEAGRRSPLAGLDGVPVLHWHGDGFVVPDGAVLLARTSLYPQAYAIGDHLLALQCHPEMGGAGDRFADWLADSAAELAAAALTPEALTAAHRRHGAQASAAGAAMLAAWLDRLAG